MPTEIDSIAGVRAHGQAELLREVAHALLAASHGRGSGPARLDAEDDVLGDRHHRDEHEVLVHHADPGVDRVTRRADPERLAAQPDLALVRLESP